MYQFECGASLIAEDLLLSAAHCFIDANGAIDYSTREAQIGIHLKADALEVEPTNWFRRDIMCLKAHDDFDSNTMANDIIILKLSSPIPSDITPVKWTQSLAAVNTILEDSTTPKIIAGWGSITQTGNALDLNPIHLSKCPDFLSYLPSFYIL